MTHILIVSSPYYGDISAELVLGAVETLEEHKATHELVEVPGAFEIPAAVHFAAASEKYDGFIALGCVIRGETSHYDYVCGESARGLMDLSLQNIALGYGILTVENTEQAWVRAERSQGNKGRDAALACLRMVALKRHFETI